MAHTITVSDEQYARLEAAAQASAKTPDLVLASLLDWLPAAKSRLTAEEYNLRWEAFWSVVGSIQHGQPLTNEEIDELIGEEIADDHADASA